MPFLRFSRDKRGYEITSLVEVYRRRGKTRSRILYWFRTPPNVKVGRAPLDPECIRAIEEHHPDLEFDWPSIFEARPEETAEPREAGGRGRAGRGGEASPGATRRDRRRADIGPLGVERRAGPSERPPAAVARPGQVAEETPAATAPPGPPVEPRTPGESERTEAGVPVELAGEPNGEDEARPVMAVSPEEVLEVGPVMPPAPEPPPSSTSAALEMMSAESLARLRARYAEILARLSERISDPVELERWRLQAEKLNPDAWVTPEEVRQGLEEYETAYAGLRTVVGSRRRRSRRGGARRRRRGPPPETTGVSAGEGEEAGAAEQGEPADEGGPDEEGGPDDDLPEGDDPDED